MNAFQRLAASPVSERPRDALTIPSLIKRNTLLLAAAQSFVGIGNQMVPALSAVMVLSLTGSAALAGVGSSILGASRFLVAYPTGRVMDAYGRRAGLFLGLLLSLAGSLVVGVAVLASSFSLFTGGLVVFGMGMGAAQQLRLAAADMYPPSRRAEGLGYVLTGSLVGALGGPVLIAAAQAGAPALSLDPVALAWLLVPVAIVPGMALVLAIRPDPRDIASNLEAFYPGYTSPPETVTRSARLGALMRRPGTRLAMVSSFALQGTMAMLMSMTALALVHHGYGLTGISISVAIHVVGMFGFSLPLGRMADAVGRRRVILLGVVIAGAGSLLVPLTSLYWTITAGTFLVGLGWSCVNVSASALLADDTAPEERGRAIGVNDALSGVAIVLLPLMAGPMVEWRGMPVLAVISGAVLTMPVAVLLFDRSARQRKQVA